MSITPGELPPQDMLFPMLQKDIWGVAPRPLNGLLIFYGIPFAQEATLIERQSLLSQHLGVTRPPANAVV